MALLGGAEAGLAVRLGLSMILLQLGIGTVNDVVDAPFDAGLKRGKPIPAGLVPAAPARAVAVALFAAGIAMGLRVSTAIGALAGLVAAIGLAYDLALKGTPWSWLPFAVGIPILPVYGWLGARGGLAPAFAILLPAAVAAGAALAIGNSLVDVERDVAAGRTSVAARLGRRRAGIVALALFVAVTAAAGISVATLGGGPVAGVATAAIGTIAVAASVVAGRAASTAVRERCWRIEAVSAGLLAVAWVGQVLR